MDFSMKRNSQGRNNSEHDHQLSLEHLPILSEHRGTSSTSPSSPSSSEENGEIIVNIDASSDANVPSKDLSPSLWRQSSYEFWTDQKGGDDSEEHEMSDVEKNQPSGRPPRSMENIRSKVSFQTPSKQSPEDDNDKSRNNTAMSGEDSVAGRLHPRKQPSNVSVAYNTAGAGGDRDEVVKCTSFQRRPSFLTSTKTVSRLSDPPIADRRSDRIPSGPLKSGRVSGILEKVPGLEDDDDDDEILIDDVPSDDFKTAKLDALTLLQWISLFTIISLLVCTLKIPEWKRAEFRGLELWKWEVLVLVMICGRLVSGWAIRILVFFIERNFILRKRVLYFVYGLRKAVQNCIWLGLVLIAWQCFFDHKIEGNNEFLWLINKLLWCIVTATLLWLLKTLMVKVLASSFHVSTFFDRIQDSLFNQYVIEMLSGPPLIESQNNQDEDERTMIEISKLQNAGATLPADLRSAIPSPAAKSGRGFQTPGRPESKNFSGSLKNSSNKREDTITIDHLHQLNPKNISAWNMKRLMNVVRHGSLVTLDEQIEDLTEEDESTNQIKSEHEAKLAARKIFKNVARPRSKYIYMNDLGRFLRDEEAMKVMSLLAGSTEYERISKKDLKNWVVNAFRERRALALTLNDTKTAVNKLHQMVNVLVGVVIFIICILILGLASSQFLLAVSSQVVVVTFIFGNFCKTVFEAIIFLFVIHPFDVGDRCEIGGIQMIVEEMNILTTVFLRYDNQKIIYPNSTLSTIPIHNYYRSPDMDDAIEFYIHIATPMEKINLMKQKILSYIENKKDYWYPNAILIVRDMDQLNRIKMNLWPTHKMNHQNMIERHNRRSLLVEEILKIVKELGIEYQLYPLDINIKNMSDVNFTRMPSTWSSPTSKDHH
ncbi:Mechanosensitive ion channel protein [Heracleum sosnowskyi]|uniref:Mechanosensitive ion channel protein n=1 Tax=Heracleum sosnowskyi TaxID=360622 RepID=A0AAD8J106_9APIA|nr:Mechanosensitive ion channel protein [Heracleum sosnowskyi]